jgi:hypothetical protein
MAAPVSITDPDMHRVQEVTQSECEWKPGDKDLLGSSDLQTQPVEKCKSEDVSHFPTGTTTKKSATSLDK